VPRLTVSMTGGERLPVDPEAWEDTHLTLSAQLPGKWRDVFTGTECRAVRQGQGQVLRVADLLRQLPVALLEATGG
jgi:maltooligosyltrehalose synthase